MAAESHTSASMPSIISEDHSVEERLWLVSLVKSIGREHAFLLVEGIYEGIPRYLRSDLFLMLAEPSGSAVRDALSNIWQQLAGQGLSRVKDIEPEKYEELLNSCEHQSWSMTQSQAEKLMTRLQRERENPHLHTYTVSGYHPSSLVSSSIVRAPHNCVTWCQMILKEELNIDTGVKWYPIKHPSTVVRKAIESARGRDVIPAPASPPRQESSFWSPASQKTPAAETSSSVSPSALPSSLANRMGGF